ncbi:hypothetical protein KCP69_15935 [Salmonella enterica subsp. enterica]|nr:hypothetical protein KCP69_15935 [Salmonella enterica subsp. enterica]
MLIIEGKGFGSNHRFAGIPLAKNFANYPHFAQTGLILPLTSRSQPPCHSCWSSQFWDSRCSGLVSTLLNHAYLHPSRPVQTFYR